MMTDRHARELGKLASAIRQPNISSVCPSQAQGQSQDWKQSVSGMVAKAYVAGFVQGATE
jgi:hypothetical protein